LSELPASSRPLPPFTVAHPDDENSRKGEIAMHTVLDSLHTYFEKLLSWLHPYFDKLLASPYHWMAYAAGAAVLLIFILLARLTFRPRRREEEDISVTTAYPSMFGLTSLPAEPKRAAWESTPPPSVSNVTAINEALTVPCIHCGVTISSREDSVRHVATLSPSSKLLSQPFRPES
jgi:hypothetical protein